MLHIYDLPTTEQRLQEETILAVHRRGGIAALAEWAVVTANRVNKEEIYDLQRQVEKLKDQLADRDHGFDPDWASHVAWQAWKADVEREEQG